MEVMTDLFFCIMMYIGMKHIIKIEKLREGIH